MLQDIFASTESPQLKIFWTKNIQIFKKNNKNSSVKLRHFPKKVRQYLFQWCLPNVMLKNIRSWKQLKITWGLTKTLMNGWRTAVKPERTWMSRWAPPIEASVTWLVELDDSDQSRSTRRYTFIKSSSRATMGLRCGAASVMIVWTEEESKFSSPKTALAIIPP